MGIEDRDWYRDLYRERAGLKPKWSLWRSKNKRGSNDPHNPYYVKPEGSTSKPREQQESDVIFLSRTGQTEVEENRPTVIHPVLTLLMLASICLAVYLVLRLISKFSV